MEHSRPSPIQLPLRLDGLGSPVRATRLRWSDAERALTRLRRRPSDRRTLQMLAHLPLVHAAVLARLLDHRGGAAVYRSLSHLHEAGLVGSIRPPLERGCSPRRYYLTDLGIATLALDQDLDPRELAHSFHLRGTDLLDLLPSLPPLAAAYELLGALAASGPVQPSFLAWRRPWRYRYRPLRARTPVTVTLPAYAAFSWDGRAGGFLLLPDLGELPLSAHRATLPQLYALQRQQGLPTLLIAAPGAGRAAAWASFLEELREVHHDYRLPVYLTPWAELPTEDDALLTRTGQVPARQFRQTVSLPRLRPRRPSIPLPRPVGEALTSSPPPGARCAPGHVALTLSPADRALVELVGRHPFLTVDRPATVLNGERKVVRSRRDRLIALGLMRLVGADEVGRHATLELVELTVAGMRLLAAGQGLSLGRAIPCHGLTGGGPTEPIGARQALLANLEHTLGADAQFVRLYETAHQLAALGTDDAVLEWQNGTACSRRHLRRHQAHEKEKCLAAGRAWAANSLIFTTQAGKPLDPGYIRRAFTRCLQRAGLPRVRVHDLRHTAATCHLGMGTHPKVVQEMLGHSSITLTLDTYGHYIPALHREAAQQMDRLFGVKQTQDGGTTPAGGGSAVPG